jgi:hypothetical protein
VFVNGWTLFLAGVCAVAGLPAKQIVFLHLDLARGDRRRRREWDMAGRQWRADGLLGGGVNFNEN